VRIGLQAWSSILAVIFVVSGCAVKMPPPLPKDARIQCSVESLRDLTGTHDSLEPSFESLLARKLKDDYSHLYFPGSYPTRERTEFVRNSFRAAVPGKSDATLGVVLDGTVEQVAYGRADNISEYITSTWLLGVWGLLLSESRGADRAAFTEYRFEVRDVRTGESLGVIVAQGASRSSTPDRERIVEGANKLAVEHLVFQLNQIVGKKLGIDAMEFHVNAKALNFYESALWVE